MGRRDVRERLTEGGADGRKEQIVRREIEEAGWAAAASRRSIATRKALERGRVNLDCENGGGWTNRQASRDEIVVTKSREAGRGTLQADKLLGGERCRVRRSSARQAAAAAAATRGSKTRQFSNSSADHTIRRVEGRATCSN